MLLLPRTQDSDGPALTLHASGHPCRCAGRDNGVNFPATQRSFCNFCTRTRDKTPHHFHRPSFSPASSATSARISLPGFKPPVPLSTLVSLCVTSSGMLSVPAEVLHHIARHAMILPASLTLPTPEHLPLVFPDNPSPPKTGVTSFALAQRSHLAAVTHQIWQHVVLSDRRHLHGVLSMPQSPSTWSLCARTIRCDILEPYTPCIPPAFQSFLMSMRNLKTLSWAYPPRSFFSDPSTAQFPSVKTLQIAALPPNFSEQDLLRLSTTFPGLSSLNIVQAASTAPDRGLEDPDVLLWPGLRRLTLGCRTNFLPQDPLEEHLLLEMMSGFPDHTLFPGLQYLCVEDNVTSLTSFLQRHGPALTTLATSSCRPNLARTLSHFCFPPSIHTLIVNLDSVCHTDLPLPPTITRIVLVLPFVPTWRRLPTLKASLISLLTAIASFAPPTLREVLCECRSSYNLSSSWLFSECSKFDTGSIKFTPFEFRESQTTPSAPDRSILLSSSSLG